METEIEKAYPVEEFDPTLKHVLGTVDLIFLRPKLFSRIFTKSYFFELEKKSST